VENFGKVRTRLAKTADWNFKQYRTVRGFCGWGRRLSHFKVGGSARTGIFAIRESAILRAWFVRALGKQEWKRTTFRRRPDSNTTMVNALGVSDGASEGSKPDAAMLGQRLRCDSGWRRLTLARGNFAKDAGDGPGLTGEKTEMLEKESSAN